MSRLAVSSRLVVVLAGLSLFGLGCSDLTSPNAITIQKEPLAPPPQPGDAKPAAAPAVPGGAAPAKAQPAQAPQPMVQPVPAGGSCG